MKDLSGYIFVRLRFVRLNMFRMICSAWVRASFSLRGIRYGRSLKCYGLPIAVRMVDSRMEIGNGCTFRSDSDSNLVGVNRKCIIATLRRKAEVIIGDGSGFSGTVVAAAGSIRIGKNVLCGANTTITDFDWHGIDPDKRAVPEPPKPVVIEDNVWLGLNSIVLKGVTIGKNTVIGANSVVTKNIPENVIAAGNPCRVVKQLNSGEKN